MNIERWNTNATRNQDIHSRQKFIIDHSKIDNNKDTLKGETPSINIHPIHPFIQAYFLIIVIHVLIMGIELQIVRNIVGVLIEANFLVENTKYDMIMTT